MHILDSPNITPAKEALLSSANFAASTERASVEQCINKVLPYSDYVCRIAQHHPEEMFKVFADLAKCRNETQHTITPPQVAIDYASKLASQLKACETEPELLKCLRVFRNLNMAHIAAYDILNLQSIEQSMLAVSTLADAIIQCAYNWIENNLQTRFGKPEPQQSLQIMAMGKLGGKELNFSSDIDLIFAYPSSGNTQGGKKSIEHQLFFTKLAQKLIYALDHITEHGRCYRVDMRLRPLGDSGPLVMPFAAFETYYQDQGRAWERFAMQKMRIINDNPHRNVFYNLVKPFVYRRYIDFTTIDAIRDMKLLIEKEVRRRQLSDNIKLGAGGIRELEFFVQAHQLIHAGREPDCQQVSTIKALQALVTAGFVDEDLASKLKADYLYLRRVEHFLQMFNDEQTQTLPESEQNQKRLSQLLNFEDYQQCLKRIQACMTGIHGAFRSVVDDANQRDDEEHKHEDELSLYQDLWSLALEPEESASLLANNLEPESLALLSKEIAHCKIKLQKAGLSERAMRSVNRLLPLLLSEFKVDEQKRLNSHQVVGIFTILNAVMGRVTYIDLLLENPAVRARLLTLCQKSPWVAQQISIHPILLDELLHPVYLCPDQRSLDTWKQHCKDELQQIMLRIEPDDIEAVMDELRQFKHAYQLRIAAADISDTMPINQVSDKLSLLAQVILEEVCEQAWRQSVQKYGVPKGQSTDDKGFGIIAYGKFGGIELSYGSDLDLVCVYSATQDAFTDDSGSRKSVSHQDFYVKLVQRITHYCITKTYQGVLYDIDLRLRPSGNSGVLISHINSYGEYLSSTAWTWELQALVRSRMVLGDKDLQNTFQGIRKRSLATPRDSEKLRNEVHEMREKMRKHLNKTSEEFIDIKQCEGGIVDIEFMTQFWVLKHSFSDDTLCEYSDNLRIIDRCAEAGILESHSAEQLKSDYLWLRHLAHRLQLSERSLATPSAVLSNIMRRTKAMYERILVD